MKILTWHLRKDLNLRTKWWHRLLLVVYAFFLIFLFGIFFNNLDFKIFNYPQWKMVSTVGERIDSNLNTLNQLTLSGEKVGEINSSSFSLNIPVSSSAFSDESNKNIYCSNNIINYVQDILAKRSIKNLSLGRKDWASLEEFNSFLIKTDDKCVLVDSYTVYDNYGSEIGKTYFLRPDKTLLMGETLSENYGFHKISIFWSGLYFVGDLAFLLLLVLLVAYIISFFYHKVVLYIIFGKYNI